MLRIVTQFCLLLSLILIVSGAYVRLSDTGIGCSEWPECYNLIKAIPDLSVSGQVAQTIPEPMRAIVKLWKETGHHYIAGALVLGVLLLLVLAARRKNCRKEAVGLALLLLSLLALQAGAGWWLIASNYLPLAVVSHQLLGLIIFWLLLWGFLRSKPGLQRTSHNQGPSILALCALLLVFLQIFLGAWVSINFAASACLDFPQCQGSWWPHADYREALNVLQGYFTGSSAILSFQGQIAVHWLHRLGALLTFLVLMVLIFKTLSSKKPIQVRTGGKILCILLWLQTGLGIAMIHLGLPLWMTVLHSAIATLLPLPILYIYIYSRYCLITTSENLRPSVLGKVTSETLLDNIATPATAPADEIYLEPEPETLYQRLRTQLQRTRSGLSGVFSQIAIAQQGIDEDLLEELETLLIMADVGVEATAEILQPINAQIRGSHSTADNNIAALLKQELLRLLKPCDVQLQIPKQDTPFVILVVGVNGAGKTTTIGKLAKRMQAQGHSVMLAAGDTFRAAAVEQLQIWGERNNIHVVAQHTGADSASVIYDGLQSAQAKGVDVLIADTAGRLHTKSNLMEELKKIKRIMGKIDPQAPQEVLLVLDAGTGQNALSQARQFNDTVALTGIALTKLDGTAKGGVIFALAKQFGLPIRYIGVGEGIDDLQDFHAEQFVEALFANED